MARAFERFIDWLVGPFARELARMPASSFRYLLNGLSARRGAPPSPSRPSRYENPAPSSPGRGFSFRA